MTKKKKKVMRLDRVVIYWLKKNVSPTEGKWETKLQLYLHYITLTLVLFYSLTSINKIVCRGQVFLGSGFSFIPLTLACFVCVCVCLGNLPLSQSYLCYYCENYSILSSKSGLLRCKETIRSAGNTRLIPGLGRSWRRKWQTTPVFLCERSYGQRSLEGHSTQGLKKVRRDWATEQQQQRL